MHLSERWVQYWIILKTLVLNFELHKNIQNIHWICEGTKLHVAITHYVITWFNSYNSILVNKLLCGSTL